MKTYRKTAKTVLIVDEYPLFRKSLRSLLGKVSGYEVIDEAESGLEGFRKAMKHKPDLIIMDISLPDMSGIHFINRLKDSGINSRIIIVSLHSDAVYVSEAFKYGVSGYFSKLSELGLLVNDLKVSKRTDRWPMILNTNNDNLWAKLKVSYHRWCPQEMPLVC